MVKVALRTKKINDIKNNIDFDVTILYPTEVEPTETNFGRLKFNFAIDASVQKNSAKSDQFKLVVISHGSGSSPYVHGALAFYLAQNGFIVAIPEHFKNNRQENSLENTIENLVLRPLHLKLVIDDLVNELDLNLDSNSVSVIGHSIGGYSALALAGGRPYWSMDQPLLSVHDLRIKSIVLLAPATGWFARNSSLEKIQARVLIYAAEHDIVTPKWQAQLVVDLLPKTTVCILNNVLNAGHCSFLSPFPKELIEQKFPPALDPDGFDRNSFNIRMKKEITDFFKANQT